MGDDAGPTASLIIFVFLLFIDVFFYGFGAAVQALNEKEVSRRAEEEKDKRAKRILKIMKDPTRYVNTVQLVVTLIHVIVGGCYFGFFSTKVRELIIYVSQSSFGTLSTEALTAIGISALILTMVLLLYILLTFGVLLPKKLATRFPEKWAYSCVTLVGFFSSLLKPLTGMVNVSVNAVFRIFGLNLNADNTDVTEEEIISMVNEGHEQGVIEASEAEMITNIFEYGEKEAQDIMTHRSNIVGIDGAISLDEAVNFMLSEKNSRYPVYEENIDHIIGILHLKDALRIQRMGQEGYRPVREIEGLLREARFIPLTRNIDDLFKAMQSQKLQMVIVIDEYGQTAGLVAMEDILEEIVGNIMDEYDEEEKYIQDNGNDEYVIDGMTPLEELEERFKICFNEEEFETLNGFLISKLDKIPEENESFDIDVEGYNFKILSVENKMIHQVLVTRIEGNAEEREQDTSSEQNSSEQNSSEQNFLERK